MSVIEYPKKLAIHAIDLYQAYISPNKGFCCAHRVLHDKNSCSEWIKRLITRVGLIGTVPLAIRRFRACREAYEILSHNNSDKKGVDNGNETKEYEDCPCAKKNDAVCCLAELVALPCYIG